MAPRPKPTSLRSPNSATKPSTTKPSAKARPNPALPAETRRRNTSAAEPSTSAERPVASDAETPKKKVSKKPNNGKPILLDSKLAYKGHIFSVYTDTLQEPGNAPGETHVRTKDVIRHNGSVVVLAIDESKNPQDPEVILIRQYRHAAGQFLLELPAGRIEPGEATLAAAKRELIEETGFRAKKWTSLVKCFASPGFLGEWMQIFLARGITPGQATPDEDERIELVPTTLSHTLDLMAAGKLHDGKTIAGLSLLHQAILAKRLPPL